MAEWLYEAGIGENRAALVADDRLLQARIELPGLRAGTVARARLRDRGTGLVELEGGEEALVAPVPAGLPEGGALTVEIVREAMPERGRAKRARAVPSDAAPAPGPDLLARIAATGLSVRTLRPHEPDLLEQAGWGEVLEEATDGEIVFGRGALRMSVTPAMTLFDVDGAAPLEPLAVAAATAVGAAIVRHDVTGSIGIDFPTLEGRAPRQAVAAALDAALAAGGAGPFERTAVNGFGFLQLIRRRTRPSLPELLLADPAAAALRALLRRLERVPPPGTPRQPVTRAMAATLARHPEWSEELARRTGVVTRFETD
ncbi:ribonuclease [Sphingomonas aracearum]|uniref:Ribonuclease n=1 Tax=Sphingomonas aracearum TaxID=2283317 RepID=A0A369VS87_9SPHN|nr:ribonuclease [Sphingomonas aracearum]RDE04893.1 ribonuclease [Sphingomonas aracearum]